MDNEQELLGVSGLTYLGNATQLLGDSSAGAAQGQQQQHQHQPAAGERKARGFIRRTTLASLNPRHDARRWNKAHLTDGNTVAEDRLHRPVELEHWIEASGDLSEVARPPVPRVLPAEHRRVPGLPPTLVNLPGHAVRLIARHLSSDVRDVVAFQQTCTYVCAVVRWFAHELKSPALFSSGQRAAGVLADGKSLEGLPLSILIRIFSRCSPWDVMALASTSRLIRFAALDSEVWREFFRPEQHLWGPSEFASLVRPPMFGTLQKLRAGVFDRQGQMIDEEDEEDVVKNDGRDHPGEDDSGQHLLISDTSLVDYLRAGQTIAWIRRAAEAGLFFHFDCPYCTSQMRSFTTTRTYEHQGKTCVRTICKTCFMTIERVGTISCQRCVAPQADARLSELSESGGLSARHVAALEDAGDAQTARSSGTDFSAAFPVDEEPRPARTRGFGFSFASTQLQARANFRGRARVAADATAAPAAQTNPQAASVQGTDVAMVLCQCTVPKMMCEECHVGDCSTCGRELCDSCTFFCEQPSCPPENSILCARCVCLCEHECGSVCCNRCISDHALSCEMPKLESAAAASSFADNNTQVGTVRAAPGELSSRAAKRRRRDAGSTWGIDEASQDSDPSSDVQHIVDADGQTEADQRNDMEDS